jgi:hypothetical protein
MGGLSMQDRWGKVRGSAYDPVPGRPPPWSTGATVPVDKARSVRLFVLITALLPASIVHNAPV